MNKKDEMITRNIELSAEFSKYIFEHPDIEEKIPLDAEIVLLPEFDKELKKYNLEIAKRMESESEKVFYISIKNLRPKTLSRINTLELDQV